MIRLSVFQRKAIYLLVMAGLALAIAACEPAEEPAATAEPATRPLATPIAVILTPQPSTAVETPSTTTPTITPSLEPSGVPLEPTEAGPTPTSPISSPTPPLSPTPTPTPPPDPTFYTVASGDTLVGIAEQFGVSLDALLYANGVTGTDQLPLIAGRELQIPRCQSHQIASGNTLTGIAELCDVTVDDLVTSNIGRLAPFGSLESVPIGFVLFIPQPPAESPVAACDAQPAREQVIEYVPKAGEGLFCLSLMFGVSPSAILQSNILRLTGDNRYGQTPLLIPPVEAALYVVTEEVVAAGFELADLAEWYDVTPEAVRDWNGNPVSDPLVDGQQVMVIGANLIYGPFQPLPAEEGQES